MSEQCQAVIENKQCRRKKDLTRVRINTGNILGSVKLPTTVVVSLCPTHFVMRHSKLIAGEMR
jgi:hypothetical protein